MLTARGEEADRVVGLEMGADDYVTKPFRPARIGCARQALLRRAEPPGETPRVVEMRGLMIDPSSYRVTHDGKPVALSTLEFRLLYYLATRPNRVVHARPIAWTPCGAPSGLSRRAAWMSTSAGCEKKSKATPIILRSLKLCVARAICSKTLGNQGRGIDFSCA